MCLRINVLFSIEKETQIFFCQAWYGPKDGCDNIDCPSNNTDRDVFFSRSKKDWAEQKDDKHDDDADK